MKRIAFLCGNKKWDEVGVPLSVGLKNIREDINLVHLCSIEDDGHLSVQNEEASAPCPFDVVLQKTSSYDDEHTREASLHWLKVCLIDVALRVNCVMSYIQV